MSSQQLKSNSGALRMSLCSSGSLRGHIPIPCLWTSLFVLLAFPLPHHFHPQNHLHSRQIRCHRPEGSLCRLFSTAWCSVANHWSKSVCDDVKKWNKMIDLNKLTIPVRRSWPSSRCSRQCGDHEVFCDPRSGRNRLWPHSCLIETLLCWTTLPLNQDDRILWKV